MKIGLATLILLAASVPVTAHRLDEYLQATIFSIEKNRVQAELTLTPGVSVSSGVLAEIKAEPDGSVSEANGSAYVRGVLRNLSLSIDGHPLILQPGAIKFSNIQDMQAGSGEIRILLSANLPAGGRTRKLVFENRHQSRIAAYQVNCLVSQDPDIRITAQQRNYSQSRYELDFTQAAASQGSLAYLWLSAAGHPFAIIGYLVFSWMALFWAQRAARISRVRNAVR